MSEGFTCRGCGNFFFQAPKCVGCGAQKLYDSTVKLQGKEIEAQAARIAELEAALQRIASAGGLFAEPASGQHAREIARAALEGRRDDPAA